MANPRIKINTATPEKVQTLRDIGAEKAQRIVEYREEHGYFHGHEELAQVRGITLKAAQYLDQFIDWRVPHKSGIINLCLDLYHDLQQSWMWRHGKWLHSYGWRVVVAVATLVTISTGAPIVWKFLTTEDSSRAATSAGPIRIDYEDSNNMWGNPSGVIQDFDPNKGLSFYIRNNRIAYSHPSINIDVVSQVDDEWVKLSPYLVVATTDIEPVPNTVDLVTFVGGGGGGQTNAFSATLSPYRDKIFGAPQTAALLAAGYSKESVPRNFDYFTLQPGEGEAFKLEPNMLPGYYYHYRIGVLYSYKGNEVVKWIDREFVAAQPTKTKSLFGKGEG